MLGSYRLRSVLGAGAMATVWRADGPTGEVAIKAVGPAARRQPVLVRALSAEIRLAVDLDHPNVARLIDAGTVTATEAAAAPDALVEGAPWVALELAAGSLERLRPARVEEVREALDAVLAALAHAHGHGVVHRDVKPANVLRHADPARRWLLGDFGLAVGRGAEAQGLRGGTPGYAAPEQRRGELWREGPWTDLYAVGALGCWLLAGDPDRWPDALPEPWLAWLGWLREADPALRCRHAADARAVLAELPELPELSLPLGGSAVPSADVTLLDGDALPEAPAVPSAQVTAPAHPWRGWRSDALPLTRGAGLVRARTPPLVGLEAEQDQLWEALRSAWAGERVVVLARGSGASRLARWVQERAAELGLGAPFGTWHSVAGGGRSGLPGLVADALRLPALDPELARGALDALDLPDPEAVVELVCPDLPRRRLLRPERALAVVSEVIAALAGARVPVVVLEDLQWGADTLRWLIEGLDGLGRGALVVGTVAEDAVGDRPVERSRLAALADTRVVEVGPLGRAEAAELARALLALDPEVALALAEHTGGDRSWLTEQLRAWAEAGLIRGASGLRPVESRERWPPDLQAVWAQRLAHLLPEAGGDDARVALELACCLGEHVDDDEWLAACAEASIDRPFRLVTTLLAAGLLIPLSLAPARWRFVHGALPRGVLARLGPEVRQRRYGCVARAVDRQAPAAAWRHGALFAGAGDRRAATYRRLAALYHLLAHDARGALELARTWLASGEAWEHAAASASVAVCHAMCGENEAAEEAALEALAWAHASGDPPAEARAHAVLGGVAAGRRQLEQAVEHYQRALRFRPASPEDGLGFVPCWTETDLAHALEELGRHAEALDALDRALASALNPSQVAQVAFAAAGIHVPVGEVDAAERWLGHIRDPEALSLSQRSVYEQVRATLQIQRGDLDRARAHLELSVDMRRFAGLFTFNADCWLAEIALAQGRPEEAVARLGASGRLDVREHTVLAGCAAVLGDADTFEAHFSQLSLPGSLIGSERVAAALDALGRPDLADRWRALIREEVAESSP